MDYSSVLLDQGWFRQLRTTEEWNSFVNCLDKLGDSTKSIALRNNLRESLINEFYDGLYLIERAFEFESLLIDSTALKFNGTEIPKQLLDFIKPISASDEVYKSATKKADDALSTESKFIPYDENVYWPKTEYYDRLFKEKDLFSIDIAQSNPSNDWARVFFYLEFASELKVTPLLSEHKSKFISDLTNKLPSIHEQIIKLLDNKFLGEFKKISEDYSNYYQAKAISCPPILEYVTKMAIDKNKSAIDIFNELKLTDEAIEYKRFLESIRRDMSEGRSGIIKAHKKIKEIADFVDDWSSKLDVKSGVTYKRRSIELSVVPKLGTIFSMFGMNNFEFNDPIIVGSPPGYITFCSRWYS